MKEKKEEKSWGKFKQKFMIRVTEGLFQATKKVAEKYDATPSEVARRALEKYVKDLGFSTEEPKGKLP